MQLTKINQEFKVGDRVLLPSSRYYQTHRLATIIRLSYPDTCICRLETGVAVYRSSGSLIKLCSPVPNFT